MNIFNFFSATFLIILFAANTCVAEPHFLSQKITNQNFFNIDISELLPFYETLTADEKSEQLLDWALYGLVSQLNIPSDKAADILQNNIPMRYP